MQQVQDPEEVTQTQTLMRAWRYTPKSRLTKCSLIRPQDPDSVVHVETKVLIEKKYEILIFYDQYWDDTSGTGPGISIGDTPAHQKY